MNKIKTALISVSDKRNLKPILNSLKKNNINVVFGVLKNECEELHKNFLCFNKNSRPYIILKWAQTNDKFISPLKKIEKKWIQLNLLTIV